jgi:GMP synthase-like glutamine amidotransferase
MLMGIPLRIGCFMHVPFEGPGVIATWAEEKGHRMEYTMLYEGTQLPGSGDTDLLVIMGGPMNVFDFHAHPWMKEEINWVADYIGTGKRVLGICLGAQIIAAALGADVYPGEHKEIGWHALQFLPCLGGYRIFNELPRSRKVFHWHGNTFHIPAGADRIAGTKAFSNQGFIYQGRALALQFHLEVTPDTVRSLVDNCRDELVPGPFVQSEKEILDKKHDYRENQALMYRFMDYLACQD